MNFCEPLFGRGRIQVVTVVPAERLPGLVHAEGVRRLIDGALRRLKMVPIGEVQLVATQDVVRIEFGVGVRALLWAPVHSDGIDPALALPSCFGIVDLFHNLDDGRSRPANRVVRIGVRLHPLGTIARHDRAQHDGVRHPALQRRENVLIRSKHVHRHVHGL
eukprot:24358-Pyramimonas_sp.AAC.1